ncbi:hypothetical protein PLICRDRAFT_176618 [Plicaturopsis crispa FD-325 SS-3]|nr:hypothetical protein PLICRDRAFT_176618 [Plicaturopsis crispa FD-325 SS-3]
MSPVVKSLSSPPLHTVIEMTANGSLSFDVSGPNVLAWQGMRCIYTSKKPFDDIVLAVRATTAKMPIDPISMRSGFGISAQEDFEKCIAEAASKAEKPSGLFRFMEINHADWLDAYRPGCPKLRKFVIGSPTVLKNMAQYDAAATLHAPWDFLLQEVIDEVTGEYVGTKIIFDLPSATMASKVGGEALLRESKKLDAKFKAAVESWIAI